MPHHFSDTVFWFFVLLSGFVLDCNAQAPPQLTHLASDSACGDFRRVAWLDHSCAGTPITSDTPWGQALGVQPGDFINMYVPYTSGQAMWGQIRIDLWMNFDTIVCPNVYKIIEFNRKPNYGDCTW